MDVIPEKLVALLPKSIEENLYSDTHPGQAALIWLHKSLLKKWHGGKKSKIAEKRALDLFLECNERCANWEPDTSSYFYDVFERARLIANDVLHRGDLSESCVSLWHAMSKGRTGPGSSIGTKNTDFVGKMFSSKLTYYGSDSLYKFYLQGLSPTWRLSEQHRQKLWKRESVKGSRLTFALKNAQIARVINTEASLNMFFQLGLGECICEALWDGFRIDLSLQPNINRELARLGSLDGESATVDLKSASDLISYDFCKRFFPRDVFAAMDGLRAKYVQLPKVGKEAPQWVKLNTFATMGNGFTFPMQTIIFACLIKAAYEVIGLPTTNVDRHSFSVFGDDIVCHKSAYDFILGLFEWCGFTVNRDKSFNSGDFRESCGKDFFKGHEIRGVYLKELSEDSHVYSAFNRLSRWSATHKVDLTDILSHLLGLAAFRPVPFDEGDTAGFKIPSSMLTNPQRLGDGRIAYTAMRPIPRRARVRKRYSHLTVHPVYLGTIGGYVERGWITLRQNVVRYRCKKLSSSSWDWIPSRRLTISSYEHALVGTL